VIYSWAQEVEWWMREKIQELNYTTWFMPNVNVLGERFPFGNPSYVESETIQYGDFLHVDFGVTALGLNTDTQHLGYVLYPGETEDDIPQSLLDGLHNANRLQDIVKSNMEIGTSGNQILKRSLEQMKNEGIKGKIYSHPIGDWGHSAGTLIGRCLPATFLGLQCLIVYRHGQSARPSPSSGRFAALG
jgi:hypothetical protein